MLYSVPDPECIKQARNKSGLPPGSTEAGEGHEFNPLENICKAQQKKCSVSLLCSHRTALGTKLCLSGKQPASKIVKHFSHPPTFLTTDLYAPRNLWVVKPRTGTTMKLFSLSHHTYPIYLADLLHLVLCTASVYPAS
jgi:hypothetical protein